MADRQNPREFGDVHDKDKDTNDRRKSGPAGSGTDVPDKEVPEEKNEKRSSVPIKLGKKFIAICRSVEDASLQATNSVDSTDSGVATESEGPSDGAVAAGNDGDAASNGPDEPSHSGDTRSNVPFIEVLALAMAWSAALDHKPTWGWGEPSTSGHSHPNPLERVIVEMSLAEAEKMADDYVTAVFGNLRLGNATPNDQAAAVATAQAAFANEDNLERSVEWVNDFCARHFTLPGYAPNDQASADVAAAKAADNKDENGKKFAHWVNNFCAGLIPSPGVAAPNNQVFGNVVAPTDAAVNNDGADGNNGPSDEEDAAPNGQASSDDVAQP